MKRLLGVLACGTLVACSDGLEPGARTTARVEPAASVITHGDTLRVLLSVTNRDRATVVIEGTSNCWLNLLIVSRNEADRGRVVAHQPDVCLMDYIARPVEPQQTLTRSLRWAAALPAGEYALHASWEEVGAPAYRRSAAVTITIR